MRNSHQQLPLARLMDQAGTQDVLCMEQRSEVKHFDRFLHDTRLNSRKTRRKRTLTMH